MVELNQQNPVDVLLEAQPEPIRIDLRKTALIVVDMQNAFARRGGYFDLIGVDISGIERIISVCREIISAIRQKGSRVIYLQMVYGQDFLNSGPNSPIWYKAHALTIIRQKPELREKLHVHGTWGANIIEELEPQPGDIVVTKQKHDGFIGTNLDNILRACDIRYLLFTGGATNICVESTLRHASELEYFPVLVSDAVSQMGPPSIQEATIFNIQSKFGWITTAENLLKAIRGT
jgi:ureidoacrylate peracid hydrolase